ncbi:iron-siderophore ABC transporter substrate-binding protein [Actinopolymorpha sp. B9G3]|uniref:ABC transporter substrate-binding protein n=1 Tax=Actinopolymorpha sp. B9G3 TaxID=3158970 RepID=UPI0032D91441
MHRRILTAFVVAAALLLAACGGGASTSDSTGSSGASGQKASDDSRGAAVTVTHAMGTTKIEEPPQRIVALDSSYADAALLLEANLVGITTYRSYSTDLPDYLGGARTKYAGDVVSVGELEAPSLEKVAALKPDLIVSAKVRHEALYDQLTAIAPTIMSETTGATFKENIRMLAKALGKKDLAEEKIRAYETAAKQVGEAVKAKAGDPTISVTRFLDGPTRLYLKDTYSGIVLDDAGLARPKPQDTTGFALEISEENIRKADADKIFVTTYEDEKGLAVRTKEAFAANPLWKPLAPKVTEVSDATWMTAVSVQGAYYILTDLAKAFDVEPPALPEDLSS